MMAETDTHKTAAIICTIMLAVYVFAMVLQSLLLIKNESIESLKTNLIMQLILVALFGIWSYLKSGKYLNAPVIFIGTIYVWHTPFLTGHYFELAKIFEYTGRHLTYGEEYVPSASGLVALCLSSGVIGSLIGFRAQRLRMERGAIEAGSGVETAFLHTDAKRLLWMAFVGYGLLTLIYLLKEGISSFSGDYMSLYTEHSDTFLFRAYQSTKFYFSLIVLAIFAFTSSRREFWNALLITLAIIFIQFLLGSRSIPFINLLALAVSIDYFVRRIPLILLPLGLVLLSAISYIVMASRVEGVGLNVFNFAATDNEIDLLHFFWEVGGVIRNVIRTMAFMGPEGFAHGLTFLDAFVYLLPKYYLDGLGYQSIIQSPGDWLIEHSADIPFGGGIGYSLVAEAYYNFGMPGCLLFAFIGWFVSRNYFKYILHGDRFSLLHSLNLVIILSLHMRNGAMAYMRFIVYGSLFIELLRLLHQRGQNKISSGDLDVKKLDS